MLLSKKKGLSEGGTCVVIIRLTLNRDSVISMLKTEGKKKKNWIEAKRVFTGEVREQRGWNTGRRSRAPHSIVALQ